ncbi:MAG: hypothetical protein HJJLKODD_02493 [Phycisphaerae bacterium]|nr:hypothetical protein [Phycisphaerae bacterium]
MLTLSSRLKMLALCFTFCLLPLAGCDQDGEVTVTNPDGTSATIKWHYSDGNVIITKKECDAQGHCTETTVVIPADLFKEREKTLRQILKDCKEMFKNDPEGFVKCVKELWRELPIPWPTNPTNPTTPTQNPPTGGIVPNVIDVNPGGVGGDGEFVTLPPGGRVLNGRPVIKQVGPPQMCTREYTSFSYTFYGQTVLEGLDDVAAEINYSSGTAMLADLNSGFTVQFEDDGVDGTIILLPPVGEDTFTLALPCEFFDMLGL